MHEVPLTERHLRTPREAVVQIESFGLRFFAGRVDDNLNISKGTVLWPIDPSQHSVARFSIETYQESVNIRKLDHTCRHSNPFAVPVN
jgi:hypothetical protein